MSGSLAVALAAGELYLGRTSPDRLALPFYNVLYPYVMFRPLESTVYETAETYAMSHHKSRVFFYTNEDGFRIPSPHYSLPKDKPKGQLRVAFLGGSNVQIASTFDVSLPGSLRALLRQQYPGRDIEVINAGVQSTVSRQSIAQLLFTVVDYHPDVVILYDGANDLGLPLTYESRANFPYNFQTMQEAWDEYRANRQQSLFGLMLSRSHIYRLLRARLHPDERKLTPTADAPLAGTNAVPPRRLVEDAAFRGAHVAAYLSNWRKLNELSAAYRFKTICVLSPAGGLGQEQAAELMKTFHLDRKTALNWLAALAAMYAETGRQMAPLRQEFPGGAFLDLSLFLEPPNGRFWDPGHVYDEVNAVIARRIFDEARPVLERALSEAR